MFLEIENLNKRIGEEDVLKNVNLSMEKGRIYGIQGKNGCGKSMLMRAISGLIIPTSGRIIIDGKMLGKEKSFPESIGILIENPGFLGSYSGIQNLKMIASIRSSVSETQLRETLKRVGLQGVMDKKYKKYSLGMKQKLGIAAAIMEKPDILILDEPSNALDEQSENQLWQIIKEEKERGALVIVSCHTAEILEGVADEIYHMNHGMIKEHIVL